MNRKQYNSAPRYAKVLEQMDLLGIMDITTTRQDKNGTIVWKLPIKNYWPGNKENATCIEVASFSTGYVRNQNSGYSNYQLNKQIDGKPEYYKQPNGYYRKYVGKERILIPIEIDRLEYLISYCLKNYYIKRANQVAEGRDNKSDRTCDWFGVQVDIADARVINLNLQNEVLQNKYKLHDLENKLATINRISE